MTTAPGGRLLVCPTPIGNLDDVTLRVLSALGHADVIACEDTRHTRALLDRHAIATPLLSFHEHNEAARSRELTRRITDGALVALVSDAGTPLISDPGFQLLRACLAEGLPVEVLPGPSAVITALVASGLPAASWRFVGFLPRRGGSELQTLLAHTPETLIAFESPRRLPRTLALLAALDPERPAAVCRELTKVHEEVRRGSASELAAHYGRAGEGRDGRGRGDRGDRGRAGRGGDGGAVVLRGEVVLVVGAAPAAEGPRADALQAVRELIAAGAKTRAAAGVVARLTGTRANDLYRELTAGQ
jgi:16S rRNA (cytidine1402-2'-O)-methyltransferase